ncbi:50S ribosomal protein L24 [bacterium]|nr:50S ribosomal protein L24 [bacterium]
MRIKKNDIVRVISGKEIGKEGKVLRVFPQKNAVIVERLNFIYRHTKPSNRNRQGGIIEKEGPINVSNLMVVCPNCKKGTRIKTKVLSAETGGKVRTCQHCQEVLDKQ